jgi:polysaccharide deacetylase family protein (PEP-CTERM system associated)
MSTLIALPRGAPRKTDVPMKNALTIDLEDYYQVSAFANQVATEQWDAFDSRIQNNTAKLLDILAESGKSATFFTLGWVAEKYAKLVRQVAEAGHEVACHSNVHRRVYSMSAKEFRDDTLAAKRAIQEACGTPVRGYRAPSFSITANSLWAFETLAELGFAYDSSIFPIKHPDYGWPRAPRDPFVIVTQSGNITEFPLPTLELGGIHAPLGGGAYLRLLPYEYTRWGIRYLNDAESRPACVYLHPWELDSTQPRMNGDFTARMRHYFGLRGVTSKFRRLLNDFDFDALEVLVREFEDGASTDLPDPRNEVPLEKLGLCLGGR